MSTITLDPVTGNDGLGGAASIGVGVGTTTGNPIDITPQRQAQRSNFERTMSLKVKSHTLVGGKLTIWGRINTGDDNGWAPFYDKGNNFYADWPIPDGNNVTTNVVIVMGADFRQLRVDTVVTSGTMDVDITLAS